MLQLDFLKDIDWKTVLSYALSILCYMFVFFYKKKVSNTGTVMDVLFKDKIQEVDAKNNSLAKLVDNEVAGVREELKIAKEQCAASEKRCEELAAQFIGTQRALQIYLGLELEDDKNNNND